MAPQQQNTAQSAVTDALGNITFTFPYPLAAAHSWQGTVSIDSGAAGTFTAKGSDGFNYGTWSGSQPYGPITIQGNIQLTVTGSGLQPRTQYIVHFLGVADFTDRLSVIPSPTALGASALLGTDRIIDETVFSLTAEANEAFGFFPCINFSSMRLAAILSSGGPALIEATWFNSDASAQMGYRRYVIGPTAPTLEVCVPHLGDQLQIMISNKTTGPCTFSLCATHTTQVLSTFGGLDGYTTPVVSAPPGTTILLQPSFIYGGPAILNVNATAFTLYQAELQQQDPTGGYFNIESRLNTDGGRLSIPLFLPAAPLRLLFINGDGVNENVEADLMLDLHRSG